jgi:NAD-dependent DNA ligase
MEDLIKRITEAATAYYEGDPIMSDDQFDLLVEELRSVDPSNKLLSTPGWGYTPKSEHLQKFKHTFEVGGLDKAIYSEDKAVSLYPQSIASFKLDGGSAVAYYADGKLVRVLSRGDGFEGLDITSNINPMYLPKEVDPSILEVRGEVVMSKKDFSKFEGYSHPRNAAIGISQSKYSTPEQKEAVHFVAYELRRYLTSNTPMSFQNGLEFLRDQGFKVVEYWTVWNGHPMEFEPVFTPSLSSYEYPIDGAVIQNNSGPEAYALKFAAESTDTEVVDVVWQKSGFGRLIPVIQIKGVTLSGAFIEFVSGHNADTIESSGIGPGAVIKVTRSNEVIPYCLGVVKRVDPVIPTEYEGMPTERVGVHLQIKNFNVEPEVVKTVLGKFCPHGMGGATINAIVDTYKVDSLERLAWLVVNAEVDPHETKRDLQKIAKTAILADKAFEMLRAVLTTPVTLVDVLCMSWSRNVGDVAASVVAEYYEDWKDLMEDLRKGSLPEDLQMPTYLARQGLLDNWEVVCKLINFGFTKQEYKKPVKVESTYKVAVTGKLSMPRGKLLDSWKQFGVVEANVGSADYLIADGPSSSSKYTEAVSRGITILTEQEFDALVRK